MASNFNVFRRTNDEDVAFLAVACANILLHEKRTLKHAKMVEHVFSDFCSGKDVLSEHFDLLSRFHAKLYGSDISESNKEPAYCDSRTTEEDSITYRKEQIWRDAVESEFKISWDELVKMVHQEVPGMRSEKQIKKENEVLTKLRSIHERKTDGRKL